MLKSSKTTSTFTFTDDNYFHATTSRKLSTSETNADLATKHYTWRHNGRDSVSNHQPHDCLLNRLFRRRSKKTSKLRVPGLCAGNSPGTASNEENVSIWWRHHVNMQLQLFPWCLGHPFIKFSHGGVSYCVLRCELTTSVDFPYFSCCKMDPRQTHDSDSRRKQPRKRYLVQFLQQINAAKVRLVM